MHSFVLAVDKPVGPTSHDIVGMARRALGTRRIGHTGTLDPFASGLLLLCVEQATRLAEYLTDLPKSYRAVARFDGASPTDDVTGEITPCAKAIDEAAVRNALLSQVGEIEQRPSSFSAKKIAGERAYDIARRGDVVDLPTSKVTIYDLRIVRVALPEVEFEVDCSSGTYVRAIARDAGERLGTGGYLTALRRTSIGSFSVEQAVGAERIAEGGRIPMLQAIAHMPRVEVDEAGERALRFGQSIECSDEQPAVAVTRRDQLIAFAFCDGQRLKPRKVFSPE